MLVPHVSDALTLVDNERPLAHPPAGGPATDERIGHFLRRLDELGNEALFF